MMGEHTLGGIKLYIRFRGRVQGPFDVEELKTMAGHGQFSRLHSVSSDGQSWQRAVNHPELFPAPAVTESPASTEPLEAVEEKEAEKVSASPLLPGTLPTPTEAVWHYNCGSKQFGPVEFSQLKALAEIGQVTAGNLVWREGMQDWAPASQIPGLLSVPPPTGSGQIQPRSTVPLEKTQQRPKQSYATQATMSMICGLLGLFFFGIVLGPSAIIGAAVALSGMDRSGNNDGKGMAFAGLVLGLIDVVGWLMYASAVGII